MPHTLSCLSPALRLAVALGLATAPLLTQAQACLYRGESADTRVANRSGEITTPFPDALSAIDCRRLRVVTGTVTVYTLTQDRQAMAPRRIDNGPLLASRGDDTGIAPPGMLQQIMVVLEGAQRLKTGSSRGSGDDYVQTVLPAGLLARPEQDLIAVLGPQPDALLASFELTVDGQVAVRQKGPASELRLPAKVLAAGSRARWKLVYGDQAREGQFQVVSAEQLRTLAARLEQEAQTDDVTMRQLRVGAGLVQAGFAWDARAWLRQALLR
jgi:hypothetical protein